ncbi:MAG: sugar ABC transporter ATP-binding protein, partial [Actinomycetes bacterium]
LRGMSKRFWGTVALADVDLELTAGQVMALLGQNGAGKSTLIKILAGVYEADTGSILLDGAEVSAGQEPVPLAFIHQDLGLVPAMSVAENIALVQGYPRTGRLVSWSRVAEQARQVLNSLGLDIDPGMLVAELTMAERALVAITRALSTRAKFVVLDEPTASLPAGDVDRLVDAITRMRTEGIGFLYVTHRVDEVFRLADTVTVLRDGRVVLSEPVASVKRTALVRAIVGHEMSDDVLRPERPVGSSVLRLEAVATDGVAPVDLEVGSGEILGLVGLSGAGQSEIGRVIAGVIAPTRGTMTLHGRPYAPHSPADALAAGVGFVAGNRLEESLASDLSVTENLYVNPLVPQGHLLRPRRRSTELRRASDAIDRFDVRPDNPSMPIGLLSGGNQQKVVVARWLEAGLRTLVLEEPTAGVDIASKAQIHDLLRGVGERGGTVVVVSSDFDEVTALCDRVLVFNRGRLVAELSGQEATATTLTGWAAGVHDRPVAAAMTTTAEPREGLT